MNSNVIDLMPKLRQRSPYHHRDLMQDLTAILIDAIDSMAAGATVQDIAAVLQDAASQYGQYSA